MNKLGVHVNTFTSSARGTVRASPPAILKVLSTAADVDELTRWRAVRPDGILIFRHYFPADWGNTADRCAELVAGVSPIKHLVNYVESPWNETHQTGSDLDVYNVETVRACGILHDCGLKVAVGHFSVGNPPDIAGDWPRFYPALAAGDALGLGEYGWPTLQTNVGWHVLRYRRVYAMLPVELRKPLYLRECGIDWRLGTPAFGGWNDPRGPISVQDYAAQLRWLRDELAKDSYVLGATVFACGTYPGEWRSYDIAGHSEFEQVIREEADVPIVGEGFRRAEPWVGPWLENEQWHLPGQDGETSLAVGARGVAIWRRKDNRVVAVQDLAAGGRVMDDRGNAGDGHLGVLR